MSNDDNWIDERLAEAKQIHPLVTDATVTQMKSLLKGPISERPLRATELVDIATALIADMATSIPPEAQQGHED